MFFGRLNSMNKTLQANVKNLMSEPDESCRRHSELIVVNESLKNKVKILTSDLEKYNTRFLAFSSCSTKLDNILGMNKPFGNKEGLGYNDSDYNTVSNSKTTFVLVTN